MDTCRHHIHLIDAAEDLHVDYIRLQLGLYQPTF